MKNDSGGCCGGARSAEQAKRKAGRAARRATKAAPGLVGELVVGAVVRWRCGCSSGGGDDDYPSRAWSCVTPKTDIKVQSASVGPEPLSQCRA